MAHLVWDWNGTLLDDLSLVVDATNATLASVGAGPVTTEDHRRDFHRPVHSYYGSVLGRALGPEEFGQLDRVFHATYNAGLPAATLSPGAIDALRSWPGSQSLLSMWFHEELVITIERYELAMYFRRVDGLRARTGGGTKAPHLAEHIDALGLRGADCLLIGDSVDDAEAAAAVGAQCVLYAGGLTAAERLAMAGVPVVHTLAEAVTVALTYA